MAQAAEINEDGSKDERREHPDIQQPSVTQNKKWLCLIYVGLAFGLLLAVVAGLRPLVPAFTSQCEVVSNKSVVCCPEKWTRYKENCYYFSTNKMTWESSSSHCASQNSHLAVCEEEEELDFLIDYCRYYLTFWIGLKRNPKEGWTWINQQLFNLSWKTQVKEEGGDCAFVFKQSVQTKDCSTDLLCVCKKPLEHCE